jgi:lysophospholipase L1-like esterase
VVVALGDSITGQPVETCPGCTPWVDRYAAALSDATGRTAEVRNLARPSLRVELLLEELVAGSSLTTAAESADAILVGVGNSDAPWNITDDACDGPATAADLVPWDEYSDACIATEVERFRPTFEAMYDRLAELRAGEPTILRTINRYNDWIGFEGGEVPAEAVEISIDYNVAWNAMICETAEASGFICADIGRAFNGDDGRTASGDLLAADYLHPSDKGYERIATVLIDLGFAPLVE